MLTDYHQALQLWHKTALGQRVWDTVCKEVKQLSCEFFGQRLLVVGPLDIESWLVTCPIPHHLSLNSEFCALGGTDVCTDVYQLPFADNSFDAVIVPYALEWLPESSTIIEELTRVLVPQGNMLIVGFNPVSLWGLVRPWQQDKLPPFHGHLLRMGHIRQALTRAACVVADMRTCYFGPPYCGMHLTQVGFIETLGRLGWPSWGAVYLVHAYKQVMPLTPIRPRWLLKDKWADSLAWMKS